MNIYTYMTPIKMLDWTSALSTVQEFWLLWGLSARVLAATRARFGVF